MRSKFLRLPVISVLLVAFIAGCGSSSSNSGSKTSSNTASKSASKFNVTFVSDVGGIHDQGFNQFTWLGTQEGAQQVGAKASFIESTGPSDYLTNITTAAQRSSLVIVAGFAMGDAIQRASKQFPTKKFGIIDFSYSPPLKNVQGDVFAANESSYLGGVLAAGMSKSGTIGFVGGVDVPLLEEFLAGYEAGAVSVNPNIHIKVAWTGSFTDQQKGKEAALAEIANGADVIYTAAGASGLGGIAAAQQKNVWAIGVDSDQHKIAPNTVISSVIKRVDVAAKTNVVTYASGKWSAGTHLFDLANNGVGLAPFHNLASKVSAKTQQAIQQARKNIIDGKVKVPTKPAYPHGK